MAGKALLVDGNSLMYRAYFALPPLNDAQGAPTNALYGFLSMLLRAIADEGPDHAAVAFDVHGPTFRHERYGEYKGTRAPTPDDLRPQFPLAKEALRAMHIPVLEKQRWEADDLIGTASARCAREGMQALIVTGDRDSFQLVGDGVEVLYTKRGITDTERVTEQVIRERYGIAPRQLIDMKALCGDTSDNIPGVPGVGEKTAAKLIAKYGGLEACLAAADAQEKGKLRERLLENADLARECRFLAEIDRDAPIELDIADMRLRSLGDGAAFLRAHGLNSLAARLASLAARYGGPAAEEAPGEEPPIEDPAEGELPEQVEVATADLLRAEAERLAGKDVAVLFDGERFSLAAKGEPARTLLLGGKTLLDAGAAPEDALRAAEAVWKGGGAVVACNVKALRTDLARLGMDIAGSCRDAAIAAYVIDPQRPSFAPGDLLEAEGVPRAAGAAGLWRLMALYEARMEKEGSLALCRDVEEPLSRVLFDMERAGVRVDEAVLEELGRTYAARLDELTAAIHATAGYPINIQSPKQLAVFLYDELGLETGKKGAAARTTNAETLEALADAHPVVGQILEYRKYAKLNGTYIEGLLKLLRQPGGDGRVHTRFDQTATATGRLSSLEPNLQNIPVRTELGKDIRRAFVAREGCLLVDADYSQIELRVLAHLAQDEHMIEAFRSGEDIHRRTAAEIYGVPLGEVTGQMRSAAKAVNFGIVYGISDFGLSRNTGLTRAQAGEFMKMYLKRYPAVGIYMQEQIAQAKSRGYVTTILGRRRYIREMASANRSVRQFGERAAMNSPVQGSAADIIKLAMIAVDRALKQSGFAAKLLLQVHDELIVEAPEGEAEAVARLLKAEMEGVMELAAPLRADVSIGKDWYACK